MEIIPPTFKGEWIQHLDGMFYKEITWHRIKNGVIKRFGIETYPFRSNRKIFFVVENALTSPRDKKYHKVIERFKPRDYKEAALFYNDNENFLRRK